MDFWDVFWLLLIFIPLLLIWGFAIIDIFRRDDLSGWLKALWIVVVILMPFLGTLIYLIFRRPGATPQERQAMDQASREFVAKYAPSDTAQQISLLSDLHDRGKLTDAEFAAEKARVLDAARTGSAAPGASPAGGTPAGGPPAGGPPTPPTTSGTPPTIPGTPPAPPSGGTPPTRPAGFGPTA